MPLAQAFMRAACRVVTGVLESRLMGRSERPNFKLGVQSLRSSTFTTASADYCRCSRYPSLGKPRQYAASAAMRTAAGRKLRTHLPIMLSNSSRSPSRNTTRRLAITMKASHAR